MHINSVALCTFQDNIRHMRINVVLQTKQEAALDEQNDVLDFYKRPNADHVHLV